MTAESDETLPTPLAAALDELFAWMQKQLLADEARSTPCSPLYHYTSEAALRGILEHQKLWCFRHSQQSDDKEVTYSLEIARRVIREEAARGNPADESLLLGLDDLLSNNPMGEMFDFYFFSLSSHRDDARQWTDYGDKGEGFAIGFSPALFQPDRTELASRPNENVFVGEVIYGRDATRTRHRCGVRKLAEITGRVTQANSSIMQGTNPQVWFDEMNKAFIAMLLIWNLPDGESRPIPRRAGDALYHYRRAGGIRFLSEAPQWPRLCRDALAVERGGEHNRDHCRTRCARRCRGDGARSTAQPWLSARHSGHAIRRQDRPTASMRSGRVKRSCHRLPVGVRLLGRVDGFNQH